MSPKNYNGKNPNNKTVATNGSGIWIKSTFNNGRKSLITTAEQCKERSLSFSPDLTWCDATTRNGTNKDPNNYNGNDEVYYHFSQPDDNCFPGQACYVPPTTNVEGFTLSDSYATV